LNPGRIAAFERLVRHAEAFPRLEPLHDELPGVDARDAALARQIERQVVRRWLTLQTLLERQLTRPWERVEAGVRAALLGGAAQLLLMDRIPEHAAVAETVEWAKRSLRPGAAGLVNAVLRGVAGMRAERLAMAAAGTADPTRSLPLEDGGAWLLHEPTFSASPPERLSQRSGMPLPMLLRWINRFGMAEAQRLAMHTMTPAPIVVHGLPAGNDGTEPVPGEQACVWVGEHASLRDALRSHPASRVQDIASTRAVACTSHLTPRLILDACAGRGTKSLQLAATHRAAEVVASEPDEARRRSLHETAERARKAGLGAMRVAEGDDLKDLIGQVDLLVLDVPCSNTGVLPRRVEAMHRFSPRSLESLVQLQRRIVEEHLPLLRPGGAILYATCSLEPEENERQAEWLSGRVDAAAPIVERHMPAGLPGEPSHAYRDGAFAALLTDVQPRERKGPALR
jgi:16S rRNA (cytosine967-C5)-methyltransferase